MDVKVYPANISVVKSSCYVCDYESSMYYTTNVTGLQYCFKGLIWTDRCGNYNNVYQVGLMFPIALFIGKKEGDVVKLSYYNDSKLLLSY